MTTASVASVLIILCAAATSSAADVLTILVVTTSRRAPVEAQSAGQLLLVDQTPRRCIAKLPVPPLSLDRKWRRRALRQGSLGAGLALLLGGQILWLAVPRVLASALLALRDPVIQQMDAGEGVSQAELLGVIASRELALDWVEDGESHQERGAALTMLAFREEPQSAAREDMLERAVQATRAGLALAPGDPKDWMQLGYLLVLLEGDTNRAAAEALLKSVRTAAFGAPGFLNRRLFWSLAHWTFYDQEERGQVGDQVRLAWRLAPGALADLALDVPEFLAPIASSLANVPGAQEQFVAALAFATPSFSGATPPASGR